MLPCTVYRRPSELQGHLDWLTLLTSNDTGTVDNVVGVVGRGRGTGESGAGENHAAEQHAGENYRHNPGTDQSNRPVAHDRNPRCSPSAHHRALSVRNEGSTAQVRHPANYALVRVTGQAKTAPTVKPATRKSSTSVTRMCAGHPPRDRAPGALPAEPVGLPVGPHWSPECQLPVAARVATNRTITRAARVHGHCWFVLGKPQ